MRLINSSVDGTIPKNVYPLFLQSHFIKTLNVRFFNVDKNDKDVVNLLLKSKDYKKIKELQRVFIFENDKALPRAYFAKKSIPFTMRNFKKGLFQNKESIKTIFVEGEKLTREWQSSEVISSEWPDEGKVFVKVDSPNGGFLVISQTYYPQWKAYVDGVETRIHRVNGLIQGIKIPPGGKYIKLAWHSTALTQGFIVAMAGLLLMFAGIYYLKRTK